MWKAAESTAVPGGERTREEDKQPSEGGSSVSGTFTDHLCSVQLATRIDLCFTKSVEMGRPSSLLERQH